MAEVKTKGEVIFNHAAVIAVLLALLMNLGGFNLVQAADAGLWQRGLILATTLWMLSAFLSIPGALAAKERKRANAY